MVFQNAKLKGRIVEKFGSQSEFAKKLNVSETTVNYKLNGNREMSKKDILDWADALEIQLSEIGDYFFKENVK